MPENPVNHRPSVHRSLASLLLAILVSAGVAAGETVTDLHAAAEWLTLDTILRSGGSAPGHPIVFRIEVPAPGILTLDVSAPACEPSQPKLTFLGTSDASSGAAVSSGSPVRSFDLVRETPRGLVVEIRVPGSYFLAVSAEDPAQPLSGFKLRNTLATDVTTPAEGRLKTAPPDTSERFSSYIPDPSDRSWALKDVEEEDDEPDPELIALCPVDDGDDHGDTPLCATPLQPGSAVGGKIENSFGDDEDYFSFALEAQETVAIEITEAQSSVAVLYDERHQRLTSCNGRKSSGFRVVRTLGPGRYTVRVESPDGAKEPYLLRVTPLRSLAGPPAWSSPVHSALR